MRARILIADDHAVVRRGLRTLLKSKRGWQVCAESANGREAVAKAKLLQPDVVILDIGMPILNGIEATRQIRKASSETEILILSAHGSENLVREAVEAGARGYLVKEDADDSLLAAVDALLHHRPYFTPQIADWISRGKGHARSNFSWSKLTPREREIIQLLAEGKSNKEVATILGISAKTVETHRANIMVKLNLHTITDLVHYAIRNEIVRSNHLI